MKEQPKLLDNILTQEGYPCNIKLVKHIQIFIVNKN